MFDSQEQQYLHLVNEVLDCGNSRPDRTGVGTRSVFGRQLRFDLSQGFPLLTTKRVFWKGVVEELLFFIRGSTDVKELSAKGVKIWDANTGRDFLDRRGLNHYSEGDAGPIYGFQWRHWNAQYLGNQENYQDKGIDQLKTVIERIRTDPYDRRLLVSAWNVEQIDKMALPPCHVMFQFYVANGRLSCLYYQRSCDVGLGVPFNIASYALLTCMIAKICSLQPGDLVASMGDVHVYENHVDALKEQLTRTPRPFPKLTLKDEVSTIDDFRADHIRLEHYDPHPPIKMEMAT